METVTLEQFGYSAGEVATRKVYLEISPEDETRLRRLQPLMTRRADDLIEPFYAYLLAHGHTRKMLESQPGLIVRLKQVQRRYFTDLFCGVYDEAYFLDRLRVGLAHERIGLSPIWYLGAYDKYVHLVSDLLRRELTPDPEEFYRTMVSLMKIINLDMSLAMDAYIHQAQGRLRQANDALQKSNEELQRLDQAKKQLTAMVVHDLRSPLAGVRAFLANLADGDCLPADDRPALEEAVRVCDILSEMISNVLDVSRLEQGTLEVWPANMDLAELARQTVSAFTGAAKFAGKALTTLIPVRPVVLRSDASLIRRILFNFLMNAVRHTPGGTAIELIVTDADGATEVAVRDNGPGIPRELHEVLFDPLSGPKLRKSGIKVDTGMGMSFCRMAAERLGARLVLDSEPGRGTKIALQFPPAST